MVGRGTERERRYQLVEEGVVGRRILIGKGDVYWEWSREDGGVTETRDRNLCRSRWVRTKKV